MVPFFHHHNSALDDDGEPIMRLITFPPSGAEVEDGIDDEEDEDEDGEDMGGGAGEVEDHGRRGAWGGGIYVMKSTSCGCW